MTSKIEDENIGRFTGEPEDIEYTPPPDHLKSGVRSSTLEQANQIVAEMIADNETFGLGLGEIAKDLKTKCLIGPMKTADRVAEKADRDYGGNVSEVKDIVRGTLLLNNPAELDNYISRISEFYTVRRVKNGLSSPGYQDANVNVELPSGNLGEIILVSPEMLAANISGEPETNYESGHEMYTKLRISMEDKSDAVNLKQKLAKLYEDASLKQEKRLARLP